MLAVRLWALAYLTVTLVACAVVARWVRPVEGRSTDYRSQVLTITLRKLQPYLNGRGFFVSPLARARTEMGTSLILAR